MSEHQTRRLMPPQLGSIAARPYTCISDKLAPHSSISFKPWAGWSRYFCAVNPEKQRRCTCVLSTLLYIHNAAIPSIHSAVAAAATQVQTSQRPPIGPCIVQPPYNPFHIHIHGRCRTVNGRRYGPACRLLTFRHHPSSSPPIVFTVPFFGRCCRDVLFSYPFLLSSRARLSRTGFHQARRR